MQCEMKLEAKSLTQASAFEYEWILLKGKNIIVGEREY